jgi:hypothetical protein
MREFVAQIVADRKSRTDAPDNDMLHALLHGEDPETGNGLSESEVIDEIVSLLIGL